MTPIQLFVIIWILTGFVFCLLTCWFDEEERKITVGDLIGSLTIGAAFGGIMILFFCHYVGKNTNFFKKKLF